MHSRAIAGWRHDHTFDQDKPRSGERRTLIVLGLTAAMMVVELAAAVAFGSMALLADGLHMASHTVALGIAATAYAYARRHASNPKWAFGTGKVNSLAGFAGAILLALFAFFMAWESAERFVNPVAIGFDEAIAVAFAGLLVNAASVLILEDRQDADRRHHAGAHGQAHAHSDHNLRAAYLHVVADAVTSLLAIFALLAGKWFGLQWMDPMMGILGSVLVTRWSWRLLRDTGHVLLDRQAPSDVRESVRASIEGVDEDRVVDLHLWSIGPGIFAAAIAVVSHDPRSPEYYRNRLPGGAGIVHSTIEVHHCRP